MRKDVVMVATTDQKARFLDLVTGTMEMVRDNRRDIGDVSSVLQRIKDDPQFAASLIGVNQPAEITNVTKIVSIKHIIDCDANPFLPQGWRVKEHRKGGQLEWDPTKVALYLSEIQKNEPFIVGNKLRKELKGKPVLNACVLDYLLAHPELIPEEWRGNVYFWGTIYRHENGVLCVRDLCWVGERWCWHCGWLVDGWSVSRPAALLASSA